MWSSYLLFALRTFLRLSKPILTKASRKDNYAKRRYLKQHIRLTGCGSKAFDNIVADIGKTHGVFERQFPSGDLRPWQPVNYKGVPTIDLANRYFTPSEEAEGLDLVVPRPDVDPRGIIGALSGNGFVHCSENDVAYLQVGEEDGRCEYVIPNMYDIGLSIV